MNAKINALIDILLFILFIPTAVSSFILYFYLPSGGGKVASEIWGLTRHNWTEIHYYIGFAFIALMVIHLLFHWKWIKNLNKILRR